MKDVKVRWLTENYIDYSLIKMDVKINSDGEVDKEVRKKGRKSKCIHLKKRTTGWYTRKC